MGEEECIGTGKRAKLLYNRNWNCSVFCKRSGKLIFSFVFLFALELLHVNKMLRGNRKIQESGANKCMITSVYYEEIW